MDPEYQHTTGFAHSPGNKNDEYLRRKRDAEIMLAAETRKPKKVDKRQIPMFGNTKDTTDWVEIECPPTLENVKVLVQDNETTGLDKHKDVPVGSAFRLESGERFYIHDKEKRIRWMKGELRNKTIVGLNIGYDAETTLNEGVDLEAQGCMLHDIGHAASLIDENRYSGFNLEDLSSEYLGRSKGGQGLDKSRMAEYDASMIGPLAEHDVEDTWQVYQAQKPMIVKDQLETVEALENRLIWANNHIERNGARLDMPKLRQWNDELPMEYGQNIVRIWEQTGVKLKPNSVDSWNEMLKKSGKETFWDPTLVAYDAKGNEKKELGAWRGKYAMNSIKDDELKKSTDPLVILGLRARRLDSLKTKYIAKYLKAQKNGILRFSLYQLRAGEEDRGTVVGRYSSANVNIQQVFKVENQIKRFGDNYIIRELMIPDDGMEMFAADGSQLQFRLFAHYASLAMLGNDPQLVMAYVKSYQAMLLDPTLKDIDFHQMVADMFHMARQAAKHNNFAMVLGMGMEKLCVRLDKPCNCRTDWGRGANQEHHMLFGITENHTYSCPAIEGIKMGNEYNKKFPAAKKTMKKLMSLAETQKFIPTLLGRRRRYPFAERLHKAFATLLQGSEADVVKTKLDKIYTQRNAIGLHKVRMPVHDELTGDKPKGDEKVHSRLREVLNLQDIPKLRVPITWDLATGANWRECSGK